VITPVTLDIPDAAAMLALGERIAHACPSPTVVYLAGDLGSGKTTLARGFLRGLKYAGAVKSPTYTLVEPYEIADRRVYHLDLYRLADPEALEFIGIRDFLDAQAVFLIEWPERAATCLPAADVCVSIEYAGCGRSVTLRATTERGREILATLTRAYPL
jgi:ATPase, YjeE family